MIIYNDIYKWKGWGGKLKLASGRCRLRIFDLTQVKAEPVTYLRPIISVVSDIPGGNMSVRSCAGHVATSVSKEFKINPNRMLWVEYYPEIYYGKKNEYMIPEQYIAVDFTWKEGLALDPKWRQLKPPLLDTVKSMMESLEDQSA